MSGFVNSATDLIPVNPHREMPRVSIIIPSFNRGYCIRSCIESVLQQTFSDYEIIVIDDASKDDTKQQVLSMSDARIRYIAHAVNHGGAAARNTGIREARGEYVAFLDSDDRWLADKLEKQIRALENAGSNVGISYTWLQCVADDGSETIKINPQIEGDCFTEMLIANFIGSFSNVVIRRSLFHETGLLDTDLRSCQDWDLLIRMTRKVTVHCLREYSVLYLQSTSDKNRISTNARSVIQGHRMIQKKYADEYAALNAIDRQRALQNFMSVFAATGSVPDTVSTAIKRLTFSASVRDLKDTAHLVLRSMRRFRLKMKVWA